ncbi:TMEM175 family protein [Geodermatophilus sp. SYSU D00703]
MRYSRDQAEFDRAIAFIDATFALATTLLVTSLDIDERASAFRDLSSLGDAIGPQFITFLIAFAVIASFWLRHHRMVASFVAIDVRTIVANLCLIAGIVLLPFSTAAVGDPAVEDLPLPTVLMAVNVAAVSVLYTVVWIVAAGSGLIDPPPDAGGRLDTVVAGLAPAVVFLVSIPIAYLVAPAIAQLFWVALLVVDPVVPRLTARMRPKDRA